MIIQIDNDHYSHSFIFAIEEPSLNDKKNLLRYLKRIGIRKLDENDLNGINEMYKAHAEGMAVAHATTYFPFKGVTIIIFNKPWLDSALCYGVLAHEIFHAIDNMLRDKPMKLSDDSDEAWAYGIGWLTREFLHRFWRMQQKNKLPLEEKQKDGKGNQQ